MNNKIKESYSSIVLACFSKSYDKILMWSHYAEDHKGFCLEFDTSYAPFSYTGRDFDSILRKVEYKKSFPKISLKKWMDTGGVQTLFPLAERKWIDWRYEEEYRVISDKGQTNFPYEISALSAVYLGWKMPDEDVTEIKKIIKEHLHPKHPLGIKIYKMQPSEEAYKVIRKEIT